MNMPLTKVEVKTLLGKNSLSAIIIAAWILFAAYCVYAVFVNENVLIYDENQLIENCQVSALVASMLVYLTAVWRTAESKLIYLSCALLCFGFLLREVDFETFALPSVLIYLSHGHGRTILLLVLFAFVGLYSLMDYHYHLKAALQFSKSAAGALLMAGCISLLSADFFEKSSFPNHVLFEEITELLGYLLMLLSAIRLALPSRQT